LNGVEWRTFRHTYRAGLDSTGVPSRVQQKLMRHAHRSTGGIYGGTLLMSSTMDANRKVVRMAILRDLHLNKNVFCVSIFARYNRRRAERRPRRLITFTSLFHISDRPSDV
jgi:hypothetical protein